MQSRLSVLWLREEWEAVRVEAGSRSPNWLTVRRKSHLMWEFPKVKIGDPNIVP